MTKSPLKYVGSKGKLIQEIKRFIPKDTTHIVEPFCGSAALSFETDLPFILSDKSPELINFLEVISESRNIRKVLNKMTDYANSHDRMNYEKLKLWDRQPEFHSLGHLHKIERAARYIYIIYFGFNGLYRVNRRGVGQCNTPYGGDKRKFPEDIREMLLSANKHLQMYCQDIQYREFDDMDSLIKLIDNDRDPFVLIDPPYATGDNGKKVFQEYTTTKIDMAFYERLREYLQSLNTAHIKFLMTNTYCTFIQEYFSEFTLEKVPVAYTIGANKERKGSEFEYFVTN